MNAPAIVSELVKRFRDNEESYCSPAYNEAQLRVEFLHPFLSALGWDIENRKGAAEPYKEVIHEDSIKIEGQSKAPDYCFRLGLRKFFVEAKKPASGLKDAAEFAYQLRRYGWSAKLSLSILTNFNEFAVYDTKIKPYKTDTAAIARILYFTCDQYEACWDQIADIFSRDSVFRGRFDAFAESQGKKKGTAEVDEEFLIEIERWRDVLAKNVARRNKGLSIRELNFAVQRTIDRIIFLRICEDRGIEPYGRLLNSAKASLIYPRLCDIFREADDHYNSGIFYFKKEKSRLEEIDQSTLALKIDDKVLKVIIRRLYYPDSPYEFSVFSADILGQVYEQFLGKVIRLTAGGQAKVEEKHEVKKAGGVYYTPERVVDFIARNVLDRLLNGKTPTQAARIKIVDPACGSGSFLITAYQLLLDWHLSWYVEHTPDRQKKCVFETPRGWKLTLQERKRILLNSIYGVDIDSQAVEVTKLSLLLKVLEGEDQESLSTPLRLFHERALPDLGENIKCGNSLIGYDFTGNGKLLNLSEDEQYRINIFDWKSEFGRVFDNGGFDAVIGNPPFLFITELDKFEKDYYNSAYKTCEYRFDVYGLFIEVAIRTLLKKGGLLSFIVPHTLLSNLSFEKLRRFLLTQTRLLRIVDIGPGMFKNASNETLVFLAERAKGAPGNYKTYVIDTSAKRFPVPVKMFEIDPHAWLNNSKAEFLVRVAPREYRLMKKIEKARYHLKDFCTVNQGLRTGNDENMLSDRQHSTVWKQAARGKEFNRYEPISETLYVYYKPAELDAPRDPAIFDSPEKIVVQEVRNIGLKRRIVATYDDQQTYCLQSTNVVNSKQDAAKTLPLKYLLGVMNSSLLNYWFRQRFSGNNHIAAHQLAQMPIADPDARTCDRIVTYVERMLALRKDFSAMKVSESRTRLERRITALDATLDRTVNGLYGVTAIDMVAIAKSADQ
jgi:type I restriction-modification system DNA methylase subunit/predicted type IV restriction endonuclease